MSPRIGFAPFANRGRAAARVGADAPAMGAGGRMPGPLRNPGQENSIKRDMP